MLPNEPDDPLKRYYSIGEVAERFGIKPSVIRFWETEFDFLNPHKNARGDRRFTKTNLKQLRLIHHLVKEKGYTLEGARKEIASRKKQVTDKLNMLDRMKTVRHRLAQIRASLE